MIPTDVDNLFRNVIRWLAELYDTVTGGFYYAHSSRSESRFKPDIESSAFAVDILESAGLLASLDINVRDNFVKFFHERQEPDTGFFIDPHNDMRSLVRMRGRAVKMSTIALKKLDSYPLYPLPGSRPDSLETLNLSFLESRDALRAWMKELPWHHAWTALDAIASQVEILQAMPKNLSMTLVEEIMRYTQCTQDTKTGLWGGGEPYVKISGAFKLAMVYDAFQIPLPHADAILDSTIRCMRNEDCEHFCWVRNPLCLLEVLERRNKCNLSEFRAEIIRISEINLAKFLQADGGFSVFPERSNPAPNEIPLGLGLAEGDFNATHQAVVLVRPLIYKWRLANITPPFPSNPSLDSSLLF